MNLEQQIHQFADSLGSMGRRYWTILIVLILLIALTPFVSSTNLSLILILLMLYIGSLLTSGNKMHRPIRLIGGPFFCILALAALFPDLISGIPDNQLHFIWFVQFLILIYVSFLLLLGLVYTRNATAREVAGIIALYLISGFIWAELYNFCEYILPGSFSIPSFNDPFMEGRSSYDAQKTSLLYFSFITMSTVGFGEITPNNALSRTLVIMQAIYGQVFIAIIVASLISRLRPQGTSEENGTKG